MPTYRFRCQKCDAEFERFLSITAPDPDQCPRCAETSSLKRLPLAGSGLIFKGSGFYITDNRPDSYKKAAGAEKEAAAEKPPCKSCPAAGSCPAED